MANTEKLLEITDLTTSFRIDGAYYAAVDHLKLHINKNEVFAIVGESGSGKSVLAMSIMQLLNPHFSKIYGSIKFNGTELIGMNESELNKVRGAGIGMIFQDSLSALNPLMRVGLQIEESLFYHTALGKSERKRKTIELLTKVGMRQPELIYAQYPHELSGGMCQRAMIAMALAASPSLLIADEPTTALDVTIQAQILDLLRDLQNDTGASIIMITHDLGVVAEIADRVAVMYAGQIVEIASVYDIFANPQHPYTKSLLNSMPTLAADHKRLKTIQGFVPGLAQMRRSGCRFSDRIPWIPAEAHEDEPVYHHISADHQVLCSCYQTFEFELGKQGEA